MGFMTLLFWLCNCVLLGCFVWFSARFYFVFVGQSFCDRFGWLFCVSPGYFEHLILVLFCSVMCSVFCLCCVLCVFPPVVRG